MTDRIVIAGAGQAAAQACETLRHRGYEGSLVVAGAEASLPCTSHPSMQAGIRIRLESADNAFQQAPLPRSTCWARPRRMIKYPGSGRTSST